MNTPFRPSRGWRSSGANCGGWSTERHTVRDDEEAVNAARMGNARTRRAKDDAREEKKASEAKAKITLPTLRFLTKKAGD